MRADKIETRCVPISCFEDTLEQSSSYARKFGYLYDKHKKWVMKKTYSFIVMLIRAWKVLEGSFDTYFQLGCTRLPEF